MGRYVNDGTEQNHVQLEQFAMPISMDGQPRVVCLHGEVSELLISQVIIQMLNLANISRDPIYLVVSTYGGSVDEMFSLYDTIKFLPCPVYTLALGKVMSAGVLLLAAGAKGRRIMGKSARIMIHPISGTLFGNVFELESENKEVGRQQELMVEALLRETKMSKKDVDKIMNAGKDYYITPDQAIKFGIVDGTT